MTEPFETNDLSLAIQEYNVATALSNALLRLAREYNKSEEDAEHLMRAGLGRGARPAWYDLAWEITSARAQLNEMQQRQRDAKRAADQAKQQATLGKCPFKAGDRVRRGDSSAVGIVRAVYTVPKGHGYVARVSVDWPAPRRINGDGWHRSDVLATSLRKEGQH